MNHLLRYITTAGIALSMVLTGCQGQTETAPAQTKNEEVKEQLSQAKEEISSMAAEVAENVKNEDGSYNVDALKAYGQGLYESYISGASGLDSLDDYFQKIDNVNAAEENYVLERNAGLLKPGEIQILPGGNVYAEDFSDLKEFHEIYCAIQYNYNKDENGVLRFVDGREDVILFTFREEEDGSITITDTRFAEEGEKAASSLEEMCREINAPYDDALEMLNFDRAYDVQDLIEYMDQYPDVTGIEYEGQVRTYDELKEIEDQRLRELYPEEFCRTGGKRRRYTEACGHPLQRQWEKGKHQRICDFKRMVPFALEKLMMEEEV